MEKVSKEQTRAERQQELFKKPLDPIGTDLAKRAGEAIVTTAKRLDHLRTGVTERADATMKDLRAKWEKGLAEDLDDICQKVYEQSILRFATQPWIDDWEVVIQEDSNGRRVEPDQAIGKTRILWSDAQTLRAMPDGSATLLMHYDLPDGGTVLMKYPKGGPDKGGRIFSLSEAEIKRVLDKIKPQPKEE